MPRKSPSSQLTFDDLSTLQERLQQFQQIRKVLPPEITPSTSRFTSIGQYADELTRLAKFYKQYQQAQPEYQQEKSKKEEKVSNYLTKIREKIGHAYAKGNVESLKKLKNNLNIWKNKPEHKENITKFELQDEVKKVSEEINKTILELAKRGKAPEIVVEEEKEKGKEKVTVTIETEGTEKEEIPPPPPTPKKRGKVREDISDAEIETAQKEFADMRKDRSGMLEDFLKGLKRKWRGKNPKEAVSELYKSVEQVISNLKENRKKHQEELKKAVEESAKRREEKK